MRKIILIFVLVFGLGLNLNVFANQTDLKNKIEVIEKETNTYAGENISLEQRLKNAEIYVFGNEKSGDLNSRADNISDILGLSSQFKQQTQEPAKYEIADNINANYPSIDKIEKQLLGTTYKNENIYKRLERLENKAFGKISYNSLNERVSALQNKFSPSEEEKDDVKYQTVQSKNNDNKGYKYYSPKTYSPELSSLEKKLLGKSYDSEEITKRLSRVEQKLFSKNFSDEDNKTRLERLKSIQKASKNNTEYKVNKFAKYAATGLQVGGLVLLILAMIL